MKTTRIITGLALLVIASFASCKKDYTCTCTTIIGSSSFIEEHAVNNINYVDAKKECYNYQIQADKTYPGGTTCHL